MCNPNYVNTCTTSDAEEVLLLKEAWKHDQSILNIPHLGDWPPEPDLPMYPDKLSPGSGYPVGWICPKCGGCYSPYTSSCPNCSSPYEIKIIY